MRWVLKARPWGASSSQTLPVAVTWLWRRSTSEKLSYRELGWILRSHWLKYRHFSPSLLPSGRNGGTKCQSASARMPFGAPRLVFGDGLLLFTC